MPYTTQQIAGLMNAGLVGNGEQSINWILVDSRSLCFPEETLFFALKTGRGDGHLCQPGLL